MGRLALCGVSHGYGLRTARQRIRILTHYPSANDVFTWLDGISIVGYIGGTAGFLGGWITLWLWAAQKLLRDPKEMWRLAL